MDEDRMNRLLGGAMLWAVVLGGSAFVSGFFGPLLVNPESNLGPVGGFVTGPIGAVVGFLLGLAVGALRLGERESQGFLGACATLVFAGVLYLSIPEPIYAGMVIEAEVRSSSGPKPLVLAAVEDWEQFVREKASWRIVRTDWKQDADSMLDRIDGVALEVQVISEWKLYRGRAPWNNHSISAVPSPYTGERKAFYARYAGSSPDSYVVNERRLYSVEWEVSDKWPPDTLPTFLQLHVLEEASSDQRKLVGK